MSDREARKGARIIGEPAPGDVRGFAAATRGAAQFGSAMTNTTWRWSSGERLARYGFGDGHPFGPDRHAALRARVRARGLDQRVSIMEPRDGHVRRNCSPFTPRVRRPGAASARVPAQGYLDGGRHAGVSRRLRSGRDVVGGARCNAAEAIMAGTCAARVRSHRRPASRGARSAPRASACSTTAAWPSKCCAGSQGSKRIAYVDIDAHHGDGVFYAFENDPDVIFADMHEDGRYLYPGTGAAEETGRGRGRGTKLNIPVPPGSDDAAFAAEWPRVIAHLRAVTSRNSSCFSAARTASRATRSRTCASRAAAHGACRARPRALADGWATAACWHSAAAATTASISRRPGRASWKALAVMGSRPLPALNMSLVHGLWSRLLSSGHYRVQSRPPCPPPRGSLMFRTDDDDRRFRPRARARAIEGERQRQEDHIELIASENYASPRVLEAQGSVLTNKYAEGYPGKRYYGGCEFVDIAEQLAIDRAKKLFGADYANVQPHSGSQANAAAYLALVQAGRHHPRHEPRSRRPSHARRQGEFLGQALQAPCSTASARTTARSTTTRCAGWPKSTAEDDHRRLLRLFARHRLGALPRRSPRAWAPISSWTWRTSRGWSPPGIYPNPVPHADVVTTTTHKTLRGPRGGLILARANDEITKKLNSLVFPGTQGGPLMHVIAAKAVALLEALQPEFKEYQRRCWPMRAPWRRGLRDAATRSSPAAPTITCSC